MKNATSARVCRFVRTLLNASMRDMKDLLGIGLSTWHRYEHGEKYPSKKVLDKLVRFSNSDNLEHLIKRAHRAPLAQRPTTASAVPTEQQHKRTGLRLTRRKQLKRPPVSRALRARKRKRHRRDS